MKVIRIALKIAASALFAAGFVTFGAAAASAQATAQYTNISNSFGAAVTLDTASCTGGSISAPFSISNGGSTGLFNGTTTSSSTLCNVRYHVLQSGTWYGCQFQISASSSGGIFASANAYQGGTVGGVSRPQCNVSTQGSITGGYRASFTMQ